MAGISKSVPDFTNIEFDCKIADNFGYVLSVEKAYKLIENFETKSTAKFSCFKACEGFGATGK